MVGLSAEFMSRYFKKATTEIKDPERELSLFPPTETSPSSFLPGGWREDGERIEGRIDLPNLSLSSSVLRPPLSSSALLPLLLPSCLSFSPSFSPPFVFPSFLLPALHQPP
jgi:hypothetical protein